MNAAAALSTAYACNSSVLCLTGQIRSDMIGIGRGLLHEIPDQLGMARSFSKFQARANTPRRFPIVSIRRWPKFAVGVHGRPMSRFRPISISPPVRLPSDRRLLRGAAPLVIPT